MSIHRKILAFTFLFVLLLVVFVTTGRWVYLHRENWPSMYRVEYASFILEGRTRGTHLRFISGGHRFKTFADGQVAEIYIKLPNRGACLLADLSEQTIVEYMRLDALNSAGEDGVSEYRDMYTFFIFRDGRLECVWLEKTDIMIGNAAGGPFFSLPMSHSDARAAFGRPLKTVAEESA